jgi:prolyl-tRNA editing enzyme YbaK/EbsC (Cys-tRNA(Pro) deacylase)
MTKNPLRAQGSYEEKLARHIAENQINAEHLRFDVSCHSVAEAAAAAGVTAADFIKTICMLRKDGGIVAVIVRGEDRADRRAVQTHLNCGKLSIASPEVMLERTGFPAGGTPPFGFAAAFYIDRHVLELPIVYGGGGSEYALVRITPNSMLSANQAIVGDWRVLQ